MGVSPREMGSIKSTGIDFIRRLARGVWKSEAVGAILGGEMGLGAVKDMYSGDLNSKWFRPADVYIRRESISSGSR